MRLPAPVHTALQVMFVGRREPQTGAMYFGENIEIPNARVLVNPQGAPDPIRQSAFAGVGREPTQAYADVPVALHLNIAGIQGVMADTFLAGKVNAQRLTFMRNGLGGQLPFVDRQNIDRGSATPYGDRARIEPRSEVRPRDVDANGITYNPDRRRV